MSQGKDAQPTNSDHDRTGPQPRDDVAGSEFIDDSANERNEGLGSFGYRSGDNNDRNYDSNYQGQFGGQGGTQQSGQGQNLRYSGQAGQYGRDRRDEFRGTHAGKGPKGYVRSDERIREDVCERLTRHPEVDASDIEVAVSNGEVTLSGTVSERQLKRVAEDCVEVVSGVRDITNTIRIAQPATEGEPTLS